MAVIFWCKPLCILVLPRTGFVLLREVLGFEYADAGSWFVDDPERIAWLELFDMLDETERRVITRLIVGNALHRRPS